MKSNDKQNANIFIGGYRMLKGVYKFDYGFQLK